MQPQLTQPNATTSTPLPAPTAPTATSPWAWVAATIGILAHLATGALVSASGLMMPAWAVLGLVALWFVGLGLAVHWRRRPALVLLVAPCMAAVWFFAGTLGEALLGWTG
jgi:hypothetical protein